MGEPMRVRASKTGELVEVKILMKHRMISRLSWDTSGHLNLPHFIQTVRGTCNDQPILHVHFGGSVARDPYFSFKFKGGQVGDRVVISWVDTEGDTRSDEALVV
ncbi:MAG: thiosulfate oxidation carrier complex protein SoxZ [Burkholderiaceae bacterium]|jgi:sulfur-oxidizing protein SoxZ